MDLNALKFFCDVVETESLTRAAERSNVSQSAISQRIRRLEDIYGQVLLERGKGKGRATVTEAGRQLYVGAKQILLDAGALETHMLGLNSGPSGTVSVATVYSVGLHLLPTHLKPFLVANPRIKVHVEYSQTGKVYQDLLSSNVDVGIVACPVERTGLEVLPFVNETMAVICPLGHILARKTQISIAELAGQPFVAFSGDIPTRSLIDLQFKKRGIKPNVVSEYDNIETIKNLVEIGIGVSIVPQYTAAKEARDGAFALIPLKKEDSFIRPVGIMVRRNRTRGAEVSSFLDAMTNRQNGASITLE